MEPYATSDDLQPASQTSYRGTIGDHSRRIAAPEDKGTVV
jgi:hypothetical protein